MFTSNTQSKQSTSTVHQVVSPLSKDDYRLLAAIQSAQRSFCITNPVLPNNPIIWASQYFLELTGYRLDQVLGRNCNFLQGPGTDQCQVEVLRKGIAMGVDTTVCLLNYRADGTQFYNQLYIAALRNTEQKIVNFVGVKVEVRVLFHKYIFVYRIFIRLML